VELGVGLKLCVRVPVDPVHAGLEKPVGGVKGLAEIHRKARDRRILAEHNLELVAVRVCGRCPTRR